MLQTYPPVRTSVVNLYHSSYDIYIGRDRNIKLHYGNPFSHKDSNIDGIIKVNTREKAVELYRQWILKEAWLYLEPIRREWILANLSVLKGKRLGCFCAPQLCHGDILRGLADGINTPKC